MSEKATRVAPSGRGRVCHEAMRPSVVRPSPEIGTRLSGSGSATRALRPSHRAGSGMVDWQRAATASKSPAASSASPLTPQKVSKASLCRRMRPSEPNTATASLSLSSVAFCTWIWALNRLRSFSSSVMSENSSSTPPSGCGWRTTRRVRPSGRDQLSSGAASAAP